MKSVKYLLYFLSAAALIWILDWLPMRHYLLFHSMVELSVILSAAVVFVIAVNTRKLYKNDYFTFLAVSYLYVGIIEFFHAITFKGMNVVPGITANPPTQLWLSSRYLFAVSLLISAYLIGRKLKPRFWVLIFGAYTAFAAWTLLAVFQFHNFPDAYLEGHGLTQFKILSEYIISGLFVWAALELRYRRNLLDRKVFWYLETSIGAAVLSELSFTHYVSVYGFFNMIGHVLMVVSGYFMYKAIIEKTLREPVATLFRDLHEANVRLKDLAELDGLTGLFNRRHALERIAEQFEIARRFRKPFCLIMADVDNLKSVNEAYGHPAGDRVLSTFAGIIRDSIRKVDIAGRYGGDEFIICPLEADLSAAKTIAESIITLAGLSSVSDDSGREIKFSASAGICHANGFTDLMQIIEITDNNLLASKRQGKNLVTVTEHVNA
ncbi:MAG: MASE3 domain-containing protein [Candidatus Saccharibacteria bacterium]